MLKRKVYSELLKWKDNRRKKGVKKCLFIKGASQVGKTTIIKEFARSEYESFIYVNLIKQHPIRRIFDGKHSATEIYKQITANLPMVNLIEGKTLFFIDEIQSSTDAMGALKNLACDMRYDVIAVGMLPDITYQEANAPRDIDGKLLHEKYVEYVYIRPLDFTEFLWSCEFDDRRIRALRDHVNEDKPIPVYMHSALNNLFREYIVVGGMPGPVNVFREYKDYNKVMKAQLEIISRYKANIANQATPLKARKIIRTFDSIPVQLDNDFNKFKYSRIEKKATARNYLSSVNWLIDGAIANRCVNIDRPISPLSYRCKDNQYKLYMADTGLLSCMYGFETKRRLLNNSLHGNVRKSLYENAIAQCLTMSGYELYYYKPDDNHMVEFILEKNGEIIPIEVKAKSNITTSLSNVISDYHIKQAYKLIEGYSAYEGSVRKLSHFFVPFI